MDAARSEWPPERGVQKSLREARSVVWLAAKEASEQLATRCSAASDVMGQRPRKLALKQSSCGVDDATVEDAMRRACSLLAADVGQLLSSERRGQLLREAVSAAVKHWQLLRDEAFLAGRREAKLRAMRSLASFLEHWRELAGLQRQPWRGVNLGGWLLLEPGPSESLFQAQAASARCEWNLMREMINKRGRVAASTAIACHRDTFITEADFREIKAAGLTAVRVPFGYWIVTGPSMGAPYEGPSVDYIDRCVGWAKAAGLEVLLDLHGCPGGESGSAPCGRESRQWHWQHWRVDESLKVLGLLAERYKDESCVTGIQVCNEPSASIPVDILCSYYDKAVRVVRAAGMTEERVAIVLPIYPTERFEEVWWCWHTQFNGFFNDDNIALDLHPYHCFGANWTRKSFDQHMRHVQLRRQTLSLAPTVAGEWSVALPAAALRQRTDAEPSFGQAQLQAYSAASHGWFFWTWRDSERLPAWDFRQCLQRGWVRLADQRDVDKPLSLSSVFSLQRRPPETQESAKSSTLLREARSQLLEMGFRRSTVDSALETLASSSDVRLTMDAEAFLSMALDAVTDSLASATEEPLTRRRSADSVDSCSTEASAAPSCSTVDSETCNKPPPARFKRLKSHLAEADSCIYVVDD
eukprot:TRINITY_DN29720_c0_g1_i1.p1 TRINITY_DN29720_c0_g1~~TRINITY_DN29720_c0_g1_i1.p1  ORF type:complete len:640 (+),score=130.88 TRINITY_DN29720_c0_g1_i1:106-2025(+)